MLTIDRPERRNAVDGPTAELLARAVERFEADDEARVLVLTGGGEEAFCAGADLKAIESFVPRLMLAEGPLGFTRRIPTKPATRRSRAGAWPAGSSSPCGATCAWPRAVRPLASRRGASACP